MAWWGTKRPHWSGLKWLGILLVILGIASAVALAYLGNTTKPPPASTQALIALVAVIVQIAAAFAFSREGKVDPAHAQRSVARLISMLGRAEEARLMAETLYEEKLPGSQVRSGNGQLSTHLSYLEQGYAEAIEDWRAFNPSAVVRAMETQEKLES